MSDLEWEGEAYWMGLHAKVSAERDLLRSELARVTTQRKALVEAARLVLAQARTDQLLAEAVVALCRACDATDTKKDGECDAFDSHVARR